MSSAKKQYRIAVIPGDGIGKEVVPEGLRVLEAAAKKHGVAVHFDHFDFASWDYYEKHGEMMPEDWKAKIGKHDAIYFGAVGWPAKIPDHISLWGSLIKFRREFDQYVNLRPVRLMPGVPSPLANRKPGDIDFWVVRENTEGEYSSVGGRMFPDTDREFVTQQTVMTRIGVDRILKFAFELAQSRPKKHLTSATKSNGISITMPYWDERVEAMAKNYPEGEVGQVPHRHPHREFRAASGLVRRRGRLQPVRRHPLRSRPGLHRHHRHRAVGQYQSGRQFPVGVRAGARLGARYRRAGHRQPDRHDLVGRDDAGASRREGGGCNRSSAPSSARSANARCGRGISAATRIRLRGQGRHDRVRQGCG